MTTIHIMIDLETWGTEPGSDIRSIGACVFDPLTGEIPHSPDGEGMDDDAMFYIACDNPAIYEGEQGWVVNLGFTPNPIDPHYDANEKAYRRYPLTRDPQTAQWWSEQSTEAQAAFTDPVDLKDALRRFGIWLHQTAGRIDPYSPGINYVAVQRVSIWSHGASFDPPILAAAYKAVGLPVPWHYRAPRDTRTAFDMAGIEDHSAWLDRYKTGTHHHALDDAICQAKAVCGAYMRLRDDTWEQAALICDETTSWGLSPTKLEVAERMQAHCAKAIRAQKSDSPQRAANVHGNHVYPLPT